MTISFLSTPKKYPPRTSKELHGLLPCRTQTLHQRPEALPYALRHGARLLRGRLQEALDGAGVRLGRLPCLRALLLRGAEGLLGLFLRFF